MASKPKQTRKSRKIVKKPRVKRRVNRRMRVAGELAPHVHNIVVNNNVPVSRMEQRPMPVIPREVLVRRAEEERIMRDQSTQTGEVFATREDVYFSRMSASVIAQQQYTPQEVSYFPGDNFQASSITTGSLHSTPPDEIGDLDSVDGPLEPDLTVRRAEEERIMRDQSTQTGEVFQNRPILTAADLVSSTDDDTSSSDTSSWSSYQPMDPVYKEYLRAKFIELGQQGMERDENERMGREDVNYAVRRGPVRNARFEGRYGK